MEYVRKHTTIPIPTVYKAYGKGDYQNSGYDHRLGSRRFGPFSLAEFHKFFTHADLSPSNIMVKDGKITAIIDWEFAGWFPEYWEYTKIYYGFREFRKDFYSEVKHFFTTYPEELDAEQAIWVITGPFDYDPVWTVVTAEQQRLEIEVKARAKPEIGNSEA
ncbi:hypothetical protein H113_02868 [Trichophyton rubrum MR1459]|nr:hypothetical protein H102_02854 [Trichophyton rubrum CBS 100081]EZF97052.1 hypothetical protein H113_02868 [Trichophyton rubrum MR1459]EZG18502.1 hypothetical protein H107_02952 [Trichophyton rubrum CBS 202.88]